MTNRFSLVSQSFSKDLVEYNAEVKHFTRVVV